MDRLFVVDTANLTLLLMRRHAQDAGVGMPSWVYLVEYKHLRKTGELAKSDDVLLSTVTDQYFVAANTTQEQIDANKEERENLEPELEHQWKAARTTAWALTYYLARHWREAEAVLSKDAASAAR